MNTNDDITVNIKKGAATGAESLEIRTADKFIEELERTQDPEAAALAVGTPLKKLERNPYIVSRLQDLGQFNLANPELESSIIKARLNEIIISGENMESIAAAKTRIMDPKLGWLSETPIVQIVISEELAKITPKTLWPEENDEKSYDNF